MRIPGTGIEMLIECGIAALQTGCCARSDENVMPLCLELCSRLPASIYTDPSIPPHSCPRHSLFALRARGTKRRKLIDEFIHTLPFTAVLHSNLPFTA
jgi:hypothetical protein